MEKVIHKAESRGHADHGWLNAQHSFSFGNWYNQDRVHFGALRVLNDDIVQPGKGFPEHPHENMEIITIPLSGTLEHKDSMGSHGVINAGEVQVMSAGTGVQHSEFNHSKTEEVNLLQIWIFPREKGKRPRYDQHSFNDEDLKNRFLTIVNPDHEGGMFIYQDAWLSIGVFENGQATYNTKSESTGVYFFIIEGEVEMDGDVFSSRDAIGITNSEEVIFQVVEEARILAIEVPMQW